MVYDLKNKVVLITGGSIGIGAKVTEFLLEEGIKHVANLDIAEDTGINLQNKHNEHYGRNKVRFIKCNIANDAELSAAYDMVIKEHGYIDIVLNNAGIMNDINYKNEIAVNITALTTSTLKSLEMMRKDKGGRGGVVMNMSSIAALYIDSALPVYFGTKSFVLMFSNCIGLPDYYTRTGVRVIAICFGATSTSLLSREKMGNFDAVINDRLFNNIAQHRSQKVESAARAVIEALKQGESGTTWLSIFDQPARDVTEVIKKGYGVLNKLVFE